MRVLRHANHFRLELRSGDRGMPECLQRGGESKCIVRFRLYLFRRDDRVERRLGSGVLFGPDAMSPINLFDCALILDSRGRIDHNSLTENWQDHGEYE